MSALLVLVAGCDFVRGYTEGTSAWVLDPAVPLGLQYFLFGDFRGLSTDTMQRAALPWKVTAAALVNSEGLDPTREALNAWMASEYGLVVPERVENWPEEAAQPAFDRPMGVVSGMVGRSVPPFEIEAANTGCSVCHSSVVYDAAGLPTRDVWIGQPSSDFNLERYALDVYEAFLRARDEPEAVLATIDAMYPDLSARERRTIAGFALPELARIVTDREQRFGRFTPYSNGGSGLTNGAATLQLYLGLIGDAPAYPDQVGFTAVPTLGALGVRRSVLCDGVYAPPGEEHFGPLSGPSDDARRDGLAGVVAMVTMSTLGVSPEVAAGNAGRMRPVVDWLLDGHVTPPFPGPVDGVRADLGATVYAARCAECHGEVGEVDGRLRVVRFPNRPSPLAEIGTDPQRVQLVTDEAMAAVAASALGAVLSPVRTGGYVAPPLTGLWASAPYLHNGSVPTVWHLLHPEARPVAFESGGHRLDFARMGIAGDVDAEGVYRYPAGYEPWTRPEVHDTRLPGRSNRGHEDLGALTEDDKDQLLAFLARL